MDCVQEWLRNKVCGWVPHPQIKQMAKGKFVDEKVLK